MGKYRILACVLLITLMSGCQPFNFTIPVPASPTSRTPVFSHTPTLTSAYGTSTPVPLLTTYPESFNIFPIPQTCPFVVGANAVYDQMRGKVVMFGGTDTHCQGNCKETWEWDGITWQQAPVLSSPSGRLHPGMAFDETRQEVVLFGSGINNPNGMVMLSNDTWIWNGQEWLEKHPDVSPPGRAVADGNMLIYDRAREKVVLFGGHTHVGRASPPLNETWLWDGETWRQAVSENSPPPSERVYMFYDAFREEVILLGNNGTWLWNGENWRENSSSSPSLSDFSKGSVGYDELHQQGVFVGINSHNDVQTWVWNGEEWILSSNAFPQSLQAPDFHVIYDTRQKLLLLFIFDYDKVHGTKDSMLFSWSGEHWQQVYLCHSGDT